jgi:hypothetical protein
LRRHRDRRPDLSQITLASRVAEPARLSVTGSAFGFAGGSGFIIGCGCSAMDQGSIGTCCGAEQPRPSTRSAALTEDENQGLSAGMAPALRASAGEPEASLAHLSDEEQLIALLKAAPDGLTGRQLDVLLPGGPRRQNAALRAAPAGQRITATAELRPNRAGRRQRQIVYRPLTCPAGGRGEDPGGRARSLLLRALPSTPAGRRACCREMPGDSLQPNPVGSRRRGRR